MVKEKLTSTALLILMTHTYIKGHEVLSFKHYEEL